jgi:hypothetical protein
MKFGSEGPPRSPLGGPWKSSEVPRKLKVYLEVPPLEVLGSPWKFLGSWAALGPLGDLETRFLMKIVKIMKKT